MIFLFYDKMLLKEAVSHIDNFNPTRNPQNHKTQISQRKGEETQKWIQIIMKLEVKKMFRKKNLELSIFKQVKTWRVLRENILRSLRGISSCALE